LWQASTSLLTRRASVYCAPEMRLIAPDREI
jgi:hypothetical protein